LKISYYILLIVLVVTSTEQLRGRSLDKGFARTPDKVVHVLDSLYPLDKQVHWSKKKKQYTADFIYQGMNVWITLDRYGNVISKSEEISVEGLPDRIREKLEQFYKSFKVVMVVQRTRDDKLEYDIEVIQGKQHYILNYHSKGYLIHQYEVHKYDQSLDFTN
jgi:hypothetical protein